jgi:Xaa-Pro aminopeptidase
LNHLLVEVIVSHMVEQASYGAKLVSADALISTLRTTLTPGEITRLRSACAIAEQAYVVGKKNIRPDLKETELANFFRTPLSVPENENILRADGFVYCMSGPNAADASAAYQWSRSRRLADGDFVLIHCNSYADGFWTDITRTYILGKADDRKQNILDALLEARDAALAKIKPSVKASEVDRAARETMKERGFGKEFKHPTGHGVGFAAINHSAPPMLHPKSTDVLEEGMVFNVEPGFYEEGFGGARHCDMVLVTKTGAEVLTKFHDRTDELIII